MSNKYLLLWKDKPGLEFEWNLEQFDDPATLTNYLNMRSGQVNFRFQVFYGCELKFKPVRYVERWQLDEPGWPMPGS